MLMLLAIVLALISFVMKFGGWYAKTYERRIIDILIYFALVVIDLITQKWLLAALWGIFLFLFCSILTRKLYSDELRAKQAQKATEDPVLPFSVSDDDSDDPFSSSHSSGRETKKLT